VILLPGLLTLAGAGCPYSNVDCGLLMKCASKLNPVQG
jgi:hypothetical protein